MVVLTASLVIPQFPILDFFVRFFFFLFFFFFVLLAGGDITLASSSSSSSAVSAFGVQDDAGETAPVQAPQLLDMKGIHCSSKIVSLSP